MYNATYTCPYLLFPLIHCTLRIKEKVKKQAKNSLHVTDTMIRVGYSESNKTNTFLDLIKLTFYVITFFSQ